MSTKAIIMGMLAGFLVEAVSRKLGLTTTIGGDLVACAMVASAVTKAALKK